MKVELAAAKKPVAALKAKAYDSEMAEAIAKSNIASEFDKIKAKYRDIPPVNILQAVGKAVKIARVVVTQIEPQRRTAKK